MGSSLTVILMLGRFLGLDTSNLRSLAIDAAKKLVADALKIEMERAAPKAAKQIDKAGKSLPPIPSEALKGVFVHTALFRLWKQVVKSGTISDALRDGFNHSVYAAVAPSLSGLSTADAVRKVADAQVAAIEGLAG